MYTYIYKMIFPIWLIHWNNKGTPIILPEPLDLLDWLEVEDTDTCLETALVDDLEVEEESLDDVILLLLLELLVLAALDEDIVEDEAIEEDEEVSSSSSSSS